MLIWINFIREVCRIPQQGSTGAGTRYELHRGNLAMNFLYVLNYNMFVELSRQMGKSLCSRVRYLWVYNFGTTNSEIIFMHKDHPGSKSNLKALKEYRDALPSYLQMSSPVGSDGKRLKVPNTVVMIEHPYNHNKITTYPSARTKDAANNLGRGSTVPIIWYDEFAFMPFNKEVYLAATPAFSTASQNAARNRAPYGMCITTTPGDLLTDSGQFAYDIRNKATLWSERYYDMTYEELEGLRKSNTQTPFFLVSYSYKQLGKGQDYLNEMIVQMNREWPAIRREVLLEWAETATDCPFSQEDLDKIKNQLKQPIRTVFFGKFNQYQFNIYEDIDMNYPPIIGVDVAGATFNDSSAITVIDSRTTRVCATLNCNFIPADDLAEVIYQIVTKWMPNAVVNIERNGGFGVSVIQRLCKTSVKKNLYWEIKDKVVEEAFDGVRMNKNHRRVRVYGLDSTKNVRARLIEILMERVMYHKDKFVAPILHEEMKAMQVKKNGKVEHSDQTHDDQVFSYLMALYVWYEGHNLMENFGIRKSVLKTDADEDLEELEMDDALEKKEKVDFRGTVVEDEDSEITKELEWLDQDVAKYKTSNDFEEQQYLERIRMRTTLMNTDPILRKKQELENPEQLNTVILSYNSMDPNNIYGPQTQIPASIFDMDNDDYDFNDDEYGEINTNVSYDRNHYLQGNLSSFYDFL